MFASIYLCHSGMNLWLERPDHRSFSAAALNCELKTVFVPEPIPRRDDEAARQCQVALPFGLLTYDRPLRPVAYCLTGGDVDQVHDDSNGSRDRLAGEIARTCNEAAVLEGPHHLVDRRRRHHEMLLNVRLRRRDAKA